MDGTRRSVTEILTIGGVFVTIVGGILVFAANATDRIALMEERIAALRIDVEKIEKGDPLTNARLVQQRADIDRLQHRLDLIQGVDEKP